MARKGDANYLIRHQRMSTPVRNRNRVKAFYRRTESDRDNDGHGNREIREAQPQTETREETVTDVPEGNAHQQAMQEQEYQDDDFLPIGRAGKQELNRTHDQHNEENESHQQDFREQEEASLQAQVPEEPLEEPEGFDVAEEPPEEPEGFDRPKRNVRQPGWLQEFETNF